MFVTGAAWLIADWRKSASGEDFWQASASWLLMMHGGGAMAMLLLLGALMPVHAYRAWRSKKNRVSGVLMLTLNTTLVATSFGLYYMGSEAIRPWMSNIHIAAGFCLPVFVILHIALGRRASARSAQ
jgi:heme A synthase